MGKSCLAGAGCFNFFLWLHRLSVVGKYALPALVSDRSPTLFLLQGFEKFLREGTKHFSYIQIITLKPWEAVGLHSLFVFHRIRNLPIISNCFHAFRCLSLRYSAMYAAGRSSRSTRHDFC